MMLSPNRSKQRSLWSGISTVLAGALLSGLPVVATSAQTPRTTLVLLEKDDRMLAVADPVSLKIIARAPAGVDPHEVAISSDGHTAYVTNYGAFGNPQHTLSVVDLTTMQPQPTVELGALLAPHGIQMLDGKVYFTAEGSKALGRYDPASGQVDWTLGVGANRTHMLVVSSDGNHIFSSDVNSDTISIFDRDKNADASGWKQTQVATGKGPEGFDVSPDGKELWAANSHEGTLSIIDLATRTVAQTMTLHMKMENRLKFTPDGRWVLVSDLGTGELAVIDAQTRKEVKRLKLGSGAAGILVSPDGARAFVAVSRDNFIAVVDLKALAVVGRLETGRGVDGMTWAVRN
jgi:YVTN family beta-propeller protein